MNPLVILLLTLFVLTILYVITLIYLSSGFSKIKKQPRTNRLVSVSVIVCAHDEEKHLPQCIEHLRLQDYPANQVEFILVNDRSADATKTIIEKIAGQDKRFKGLHINDRLADFAPKKRAIDLAIQQAKGEIICLTDADGRPGRKWLKTMVSYFTEDTDMVIGYAPYTTKPEKNFNKRLLALEYLSHAAVAAASTGVGYPATCVGTNMAYRKKLYLEIGGFGEYKSYISGDDDLFLTRVREAKKYKIKYAAAAESHVYNDPPQLWSKFLHQRMRYASKGLHYSFGLTLSLLAYFMYNFLLLSSAMLSPWQAELLTPVLAFLSVKWLAEFFFISRAAEVLNDRRNLMVFPPAAILHIPYIIIFSILGQFNHYRWAEENAEAGIQNFT